jgi:hypothetical protein
MTKGVRGFIRLLTGVILILKGGRDVYVYALGIFPAGSFYSAESITYIILVSES